MPKLLPENQIVIGIVNEYGGVIVDGMGGINLSNLLIVLDMEEIPATKLTIKKITTYITTSMSERDKNG
jgi:hypothetical protein